MRSFQTHGSTKAAGHHKVSDKKNKKDLERQRSGRHTFHAIYQPARLCQEMLRKNLNC